MVRVHFPSCLKVVGRFAQAFPALLLCLLASMASFSESYATHIIGGEMIYRHLGGDAYEVTLIVYRDCNPSAAGFDDPALIQFFGVSPGSSVVESLLSVEIPLYSNVINVPIVLGNPCGITPDGLCIEEATYTTEVNLPPSSYGWDVFWSQCC